MWNGNHLILVIMIESLSNKILFDVLIHEIITLFPLPLNSRTILSESEAVCYRKEIMDNIRLWSCDCNMWNKNTHYHVIYIMSYVMLFSVLVSLEAYGTSYKLRHMRYNWTFRRVVVKLGDSFFLLLKINICLKMTTENVVPHPDAWTWCVYVII